MDLTLSRILELSKNYYQSDADFEKALGVKPKTIFNWKRETSKTYYQMLPLICRLLKASSDYLLGINTNLDKKAQPELTNDKQALIDFYDKLSELNKGKVLGYVERMVEEEREKTAVQKGA